MREKKLTRLGTGKSSDMATVTAVPAPVAVPAASVKKAPKEIFAPNSDFYQLADVLIAEEEAIVKELRIHMETKVWPIINRYRSDDAFAFELLSRFTVPALRMPSAASLERTRASRLRR
jgi:hypothetical protein